MEVEKTRNKEKEGKIMLCPLRHRINSATFEECYKDECGWWIDDEVGSCAIYYLGRLMREEWTKIVLKTFK